MKLRIRFLICMLVCILGMTPLTAFAAEGLPNPETKGSISVTIRHQETTVPGGSLLIYKVADMHVNEENYTLAVTSEFADSNVVAATDFTSSELAKELAAHAKEKNVTGQELAISGEGKALASDLAIGLYLITQKTAADGYEPINPFLIMIPSEVDGELVYDMDATPKVETKKEPTNPPEKHPGNPPSTIPKTGQLWWPVPILAVLGILCCVIGWKRRN